jgi:hypothetical protein
MAIKFESFRGTGGAVTGGLVYKGTFNATAGTPNLTSSKKGDFYIVDPGGTLAGVTLNDGDHIVFRIDASNPITSAMFDVIDNTDAVASVNTQTGVVVLDTDDIAEGGTNAYFTNARADARIAAATANDLSDVSYTAGAGIDGYVMKYNNTSGNWEAQVEAAGAVTSVNTQTGAVVLDSDDITEGTGNLYFTSPRFTAELATKDTDDLSEGATNLYYTNARFDTQLATKDTDDLSEGTTNQYFTDARADARIAAATANDLSDVSYTAGAGIDGYVMTYNNTSGNWEAQVAASAPVTSVNTQTGAVVLDSDDITEGTSNLYFTSPRFTAELATKDTDDLSEGATNLYYTNARFDTQLATKDTDDISEGATNQYFTNARADARIAAATANDLSDVSYTAGAGIDGYVMKYNNTSGNWEAQAESGGAVGTLQQVTDQGATTTTNISVAQVTMGGDLLADGDQTRTIGSETNRFVTTHGDLNGAVRFKAKAGVALSKGEVVYISGVSGGVPVVSKAQSNSASTMPAYGVCYASASLNADVQIVTFGNLEGINTGSFSIGDTLFISATTAGAITNTAPTGESNLLQNIGRVVKVDAVGNSGIYKIGGAGRTNATPNLDTDKIFLGNGSNQAVSTALSSINLSSFNDDLATNIVDDTTPQLGGDLDVNGQDIVSVSNGAIELAPDGTGKVTIKGNATGGSGQLVLNCEQNSHGITLKGPPHSAAASYTLTFPNTDGTADQVLKTDGSGNLDWVDQTSGGGGFTYTAITSASSPVSGAASTHYSADTSGGVITINLPALSGVTAGTEIRVKLKTAGNTLTLDGNLSETIDGSTTYTLTVQNQAVTLVSDGSSNWEVI